MMFDLRAILDALFAEGVEFLLIGGIAAGALGSPSVTRDVDICYERTPENMERLARALVALDAQLRGAPEGLPFVLDAKTLAMGDSFTFTTRAGSFDCLGTPAGTRGFADLEPNAKVAEFYGRQVKVASIDDLIRMKRAAGSAKDRAELEILGALRDELEGRPE